MMVYEMLSLYFASPTGGGRPGGASPVDGRQDAPSMKGDSGAASN